MRTYNPNFAALQPYPFAKLDRLLADVRRPSELDPISLALGEPKHKAPDFVIEGLADAGLVAQKIGIYPATKGTDELREAIARWLNQRFNTRVDPTTQCLPVNGTREALFAFAQAMLSGKPGSTVMMPNPFYQIYEGAALLAGARPHYVDNQATHGYQQDFAAINAAEWEAAEIVYLCSPGNPTGQVIPRETLGQLIEYAHRYDFVIAADECYSEIYCDEAHPPHGLLEVCSSLGNHDFDRCIVFHSLSKRSNLPGMRSGFVAGDADILEAFLQYRTYHGCAMGALQQHISAKAWSDEEHVVDNRALYREKFSAVSALLKPYFDLNDPQGGFYHWLPTPEDDERFAQAVARTCNLTVMPGRYLGREGNAGNPGANHVRVAWVAEVENCTIAAERLAQFMATHY